jgi:hypothetical protein
MSVIFGLILAGLLVLGWFAPQAGDRWLRPLEHRLARFSRRRSLAVVSLSDNQQSAQQMLSDAQVLRR